MCRSRRPLILPAALFLFAASVQLAAARDEIFDARGFKAGRPTFSQLPFEHIDPLNGNLLLVFTDLTLPGNAGFELTIQRTYNSKIFADQTFVDLDWDSWAGVGWSLHLGRVKTTQADDPLAVEMPDGSAHKLFANFAGDSSKYVTRDYWLYAESSPPTLELTNGVVYTFAKVVGFGSGNYYRYPTRIEDPFGNRVEIEYDTALQAPPDAISRITQYLGPPGNPGAQKREITFTTEDSGGRRRLKTMKYLTRTWTFDYVSASEPTLSLLTEAEPPVGRPWKYGYTTSGTIRNELRTVTTPYGGTITYTYGTQGAGSGALAPPFYYGSSIPVTARVVTGRTTGGRDIPGGTTTYKYAQGSAKNRTVVTAPSTCIGGAAQSTTEYTFLGTGNGYASGDVWRIGLLTTRETKQPGSSLETEAVSWREPVPSDLISPAVEQIGPNSDFGIYAPVPASRALTRGGQTYVSAYTYHTSNFNDYGRPWRTEETGDAGTRTTERTFDYAFSLYIKDRIATESVKVGAETFKRSWVYRDADGFLTDQYGWGSSTTNGIRLRYAPTSTGNVQNVTDANGRKTSYTYDWGVEKNLRTPAYPGIDTIRRSINPDGTVSSEARRLNENGGAGYSTSFTYDAQMRMKTVTPPVGSQTTYNYDDGNAAGSSFVTSTRGPSFMKTLLDGFGRVSGTENAMGVKTDVDYDACGRRTYESLPFDAGHPQDTRGLSYAFDALGRVTSRVNPGLPSSSVSYAYTGGGLTGLDTRITDEEGRKTIQRWVAFGDLGEVRLSAVTLDSGGPFAQTTSYGYNTLGSLTTVSGAGSRARSFTYTVRNELKTETHPEKGQTSYTYDAAGDLRSFSDARGERKLTHDANRRLVCVDQAPHAGTPCSALSADDVRIGYDQADNRVSLTNTSVASTFEFDAADRMTKRTDVVSAAGSPTFVTANHYDSRDNLDLVTYPAPSTTAVRYQYDNANRIIDIRQNGASSPWATGFSYHPSGGSESFTAGNGLVSTTTYTGRHWTDLLRIGDGDPRRILSLNYGYDRVGNAETIADDTTGRPGMNQTYEFDSLNRLAIADGPWGAESYNINGFGDRTHKTTTAGTTTYHYSSSTGRLQSLSGAESDSMGYDPVGNLTSGGGATFTYTLRNMLKTATTPGGATSYTYDGDDLRIGKTSSSGSRYYVHGLGGQLLSEYAQCGAPVSVRDYVYAGTRLLAAVEHAPLVTISLSGASAMTSEGAGSISITVILTTSDGEPTVAPVAVAYSTADGGGGFSATAGVDYGAAAGVLAFPCGTPSGATQTVPVSIIPDGLDEEDESFTLTLSGPDGAVLGAPSAQVVTLVDDDPAPAISIEDVTVTEGDAGGVTAAFPVLLTAASGRTVSVSYATADVTATAGADYAAAAGVMAFVPGTTSRTIDVTVLGDLTEELDQTFVVDLSGPVNATLSDGQGLGTIVDDDPPPAISIGEASVVEGDDPGPGEPLVFQANLSNPSEFQVEVDYQTEDGTAGVEDYVPTSGTLSFAASTVSQDLVVEVLGDELKEANETLLVTLSNPVNGTIGSGGDPVGTILDNEEMDYFTVTPCRLFDTRNEPMGPLQAGSTRVFDGIQCQSPGCWATLCSIPLTAKALAVTVTAIDPTSHGHLRLYPAGAVLPPTSSLNFNAGVTRGNNAVLTLGGTGHLTVYCGMSSGSTHMLIDVFGYFE